jgi:glycosyltransferase involved in cell wall biosynthesis/CDP-glycerol glycerophosphotransferase (TagB/SpsB family)
VEIEGMRAAQDVRDGKPRFSVVSAVYNVARYLPEFIESIERQVFSRDRLELIMVDDGSTDDSLRILQEWQQRRPELVTVLTKPNGGQASARNLGIEHAHGEWITFPDPDDILEPNYFANVHRFIRKNPTTMLAATRRVLFDDATGEQRQHPLNRHFTKRNRLRNLDHDTAHFHGSAPCAFFRLERVREFGLSFDERIRPTFEDGHFCCLYLLRCDRPMVGYLATVAYLYRRRTDKTSTLDTSWIDTRRFTDVPTHGFLALLREAQDTHGAVPYWLQGMVLYELSWYFKVYDAVPGVETAGHGEVAERFHEVVGEICALLDEELIESFDRRSLPSYARDILLHGYSDARWHTRFAVVDKIDMDQRLMRAAYRYAGPAPTEVFIVDGSPVKPSHAKHRSVVYFGRTLLYERIVWLPFGTLRIVLDGRDINVRTEEPDRPTQYLGSVAIRRALDPTLTDEQRFGTPPPKLTVRDRGVLQLSRSRLVRRYFGGAWVLMDRVHDADDSAEHLFRYLRKHRRRVNAWFVIEAGTPDHRRLRKDGYRRVIPHGSLRWQLLMLNCKHLISSHADHPIVRPAQITRLVTPTWRSTFLQHGVTKDDLSGWLNGKNFDIFVTSTVAEQASVAGDETAYRYTTREAKLTGLPRFDRILAAGAAFPPERRDLVLIAPTWRDWLVDRTFAGAHRRVVDLTSFQDSEYAKNWLGLIRSPELRDVAERNGLTVSLLMHPNMQSVVSNLEVPPHVSLFSFEGQNVQETFARARIVVTDYSSMAFNAAYIDRPLVYFQFDRERFFGGGHPGKPGYFDYQRDGFGPVVVDVDAAEKAIAEAVEQGPDPAPEYSARIAEAFPNRDGKCCERVANAIDKSTKAVPRRLHKRVSEVQAGRPEGD